MTQMPAVVSLSPFQEETWWYWLLALDGEKTLQQDRSSAKCWASPIWTKMLSITHLNREVSLLYLGHPVASANWSVFASAPVKVGSFPRQSAPSLIVLIYSLLFMCFIFNKNFLKVLCGNVGCVLVQDRVRCVPGSAWGNWAQLENKYPWEGCILPRNSVKLMLLMDSSFPSKRKSVPVPWRHTSYCAVVPLFVSRLLLWQAFVSLLQEVSSLVLLLLCVYGWSYVIRKSHSRTEYLESTLVNWFCCCVFGEGVATSVLLYRHSHIVRNFRIGFGSKLVEISVLNIVTKVWINFG